MSTGRDSKQRGMTERRKDIIASHLIFRGWETASFVLLFLSSFLLTFGL